MVLNDAGTTVVGAYPVTTVVTPHRIRVNFHTLYAMCALDALAVAPMFAADVDIDSRCHVSNLPVRIQMKDHVVVDMQPGTDLIVGVRWQKPVGSAARSLCLDMVFLRNTAIAIEWQAGDCDTISLFGLSDAVEFAAGFFRPLLI